MYVKAPGHGGKWRQTNWDAFAVSLTVNAYAAAVSAIILKHWSMLQQRQTNKVWALVTIALQLAVSVLPQYCRMSGDTYSRLLFSKMIMHDNVSPSNVMRKTIVPGLSALIARSRNRSNSHKQLVEVIHTPEPKPQVCVPE